MIKPMLAYKVGKKEIDWDAKNFIQPKLDGVRCIFTKDGAYSRTGKQFKNPTCQTYRFNTLSKQFSTRRSY